jgi:hypothetical protein
LDFDEYLHPHQHFDGHINFYFNGHQHQDKYVNADLYEHGHSFDDGDTVPNLYLDANSDFDLHVHPDEYTPPAHLDLHFNSHLYEYGCATDSDFNSNFDLHFHPDSDVGFTNGDLYLESNQYTPSAYLNLHWNAHQDRYHPSPHAHLDEYGSAAHGDFNGDIGSSDRDINEYLGPAHRHLHFDVHPDPHSHPVTDAFGNANRDSVFYDNTCSTYGNLNLYHHPNGNAGSTDGDFYLHAGLDEFGNSDKNGFPDLHENNDFNGFDYGDFVAFAHRYAVPHLYTNEDPYADAAYRHS